MNIQETLKRISAGQDLAGDEMLDIMRQIMTGQLTASQIGGFLIGLGMKGESIEEISAAATVMRELVTTVHVDVPNLIDVVGTEEATGRRRSMFLQRRPLSPSRQARTWPNMAIARHQANVEARTCWNAQVPEST